MTERIQCGSCRFWFDSTTECRFNPPAFRLVHRYRFGADTVASEEAWPKTHRDQWCGRGEAK